MLNSKAAAIFLAAIAVLFLIMSCNKTDHDKKVIPDTLAKSDLEHDSIKADTKPFLDTISKNTNNPDADSIMALKRIEKKRRNDSLKALKKTEVKIHAYYFHPTARCITCRNIEAYSYEAVQQWEKKNKKEVTWKELNIEDSVNEHYVDEFNLQFSSLIIVKYVGGKKDKWKNLEETWILVNDKSSLIDYVMHELNLFAKK